MKPLVLTPMIPGALIRLADKPPLRARTRPDNLHRWLWMEIR